MFKVSNKDTRTTPLLFTFEQVNAGWGNTKVGRNSRNENMLSLKLRLNKKKFWSSINACGSKIYGYLGIFRTLSNILLQKVLS